MGENSIINISESRVNVRETKILCLVRDFSLVSKQRDCEFAFIAIGVERRDIETQPIAERFENLTKPRSREANISKKREEKETRINVFDSVAICSRRDYEGIKIEERERREAIESSEEAKESRQEREKKKVVEKIENKEEEEKDEEEEEKEKETKNLKKYRSVVPTSQVFSSSASSSYCPGLIRRIFFLLLSLLVAPVASSSSRKFSFKASTRVPVLVYSRFFTLVSLLVVVLSIPTMAIPTVATVVSDTGASGGTSTPIVNPMFNETNATLRRIIQLSGNPVVIEQSYVEEEEGMRNDVVLNFESVGTTMKSRRRRRRRNVEYTKRRSSNVDDETELAEDEDDEVNDEGEDEDEDDDEEDEEDAFPASLIPHTRESGHEMRSRLREAELDTIRRSIVEGLGLERIPDPSKANVSQTEYRRAHVEYLTRLQNSRDSGERRQRRLHTFHPAERSPATIVDRTRRSLTSELQNQQLVKPSITQNSILSFPIVITDEDLHIDHATLRLLLDPTDTPIELSNHAVSLYRVVSANSREFITRKALWNQDNDNDRLGSRWIELDATELANTWQQTENNDKHIVVELIFESLVTGNSLGPNDKQPIVIDPALNIFTTSYPINEDFRGFRRKRRANPEHLMSLHKGRRTECRGENKKCCRHEMTVIFKDLKGFEFIVQPKNFDAGYCKGRCPPRYNPAHHHALLQSLIWKEDKKKAPRPCCAPSKLEELEILYFDENDPTKLKISSWKNMKVLECACS